MIRGRNAWSGVSKSNYDKLINDVENDMLTWKSAPKFKPKLTPQQIKEIQDAPKHHRTELLAKIYKVSQGYISLIRSGKVK